MLKSIRSFALVAVLVVSASPMMHASVTGCDPHPQAKVGTFQTVVYTVLSYFGL